MDFDRIFGLRIIPKVPKTGLVIGTHGGVPYIHLFLEVAKKHFPDMPILIHDDCSAEQFKLRDLAKEYHQEFSVNKERKGHGAGDMSAYVAGLGWAKRNNLDLLVKMSRRFIPFFNWVPTLKQLAYHTQFFTFANECKHFKFPIRSECVGMYVKSWCNFVPRLSTLINSDVNVEQDFFNVVTEVQNTNLLSVNQNHVYRNQKLGYNISYGVWEEIGNSRMEKFPNILWHDVSVPKDYYGAALEYKIDNYSVGDFEL